MPTRKQLVVLDRNTGELWKIGPGNYNAKDGGDDSGDRVFINAKATGINSHCHIDFDYPLTPLPKDDELRLILKLGRDVLESVQEKFRGRITGFGTPSPKQLYWNDVNQKICESHHRQACYVLLAPETAPHTIQFDNGDPIEISDQSWENIQKQLRAKR